MGVQLIKTVEEAAEELVDRAFTEAVSDPSGEKFTVYLEHEEYRMPINTSDQEKLQALTDQKARAKGLRVAGRRGVREFVFEYL